MGLGGDESKLKLLKVWGWADLIRFQESWIGSPNHKTQVQALDKLSRDPAARVSEQ